MRQLYDLVESLQGAELVFFIVMLNVFQWIYVFAAPQPHDLELFMAAYAMAVMSALATIKLVRGVRRLWQCRAAR